MNRRTALKTSSLALLGLSIPNPGFGYPDVISPPKGAEKEVIPAHFPHIAPEIISEVVGKSHFDLTRVQELVEKRPELSRAVWEWRFADFESAIGAASHVGRRDIALYLMRKGARPSLFTHAMLGHLQVVRSAIEAAPGIQEVSGPHGISLLDHAYAGTRMKDQMTKTENENVEKTIDYLTALGNAGGATYIDLSEEEQKKYLGDYMYGKEEAAGFSIQLNMRKLLSLGPIGGFGGALYQVAPNQFIYNGAPSVEITFDNRKDKVHSLTITDPDITIRAKKVR